MYNWNTLNQKVLKRLGFTIGKPDMEAMCNCQVIMPVMSSCPQLINLLERFNSTL